MATFTNCRQLPRFYSILLSSTKSFISSSINIDRHFSKNLASILFCNNSLQKHNSHATFLRFCSSNAKESLKEDGQEAEDGDEDGGKVETARYVVDVATSIDYLKSDAYQTTYRGSFVWQPYRRNHKGHLAPSKIRRTCYSKAGKAYTGNPCPICRDDHLVLHPDNTELLRQFVSQYTGEILSNHTTNLCQLQQRKLRVAIEQAWDKGTLEKVMPFREYDYEDYYGQKVKKE